MRLLTLAVAIAAALSIAACGGDTESAPPTIGVQTDLGELLVDIAPPGFTLVADPERSGPIHIGDVVSLEAGTGQEGANVAAFGFLDGYQKTFTGPTPDEGLYATIEQYTSPEGAAERFADATERADAIEGRTGFDVPTIPDAHGSTFSGAAEGLADTRLLQVLFPFENTVVRIERTTTAGSPVTPQDVITLAEQQRRVLEVHA